MALEGTWPIGFSSLPVLLLIFSLFFFNFGQNAQQESSLEDRLSFELETSQETGRLQIGNLRPERKLFFVEGTAFFFSPSSNGIPSPAGLQLPLFLQPSLIAGSHSATLITSHQKGDYKEGRTPQRDPLYQNLPCQLGSSFLKPSSDYQCTDGIKITSYSYMNHK